MCILTWLNFIFLYFRVGNVSNNRDVLVITINNKSFHMVVIKDTLTTIVLTVRIITSKEHLVNEVWVLLIWELKSYLFSFSFHGKESNHHFTTGN